MINSKKLIDTVLAKQNMSSCGPNLGGAGGVVVAFRTCTDKLVDAVDAGAAVLAGVDGTLVNVDVTHGTWWDSTHDMTSSQVG